MGIIRGNIMLLRERHVQPPSRQKETLDHLQMWRQRTRMQRVGISEIGITSEQSLDHRRDEAPLKQIRRLRFFQRQRGKQGQADRAVGGGARVERVDDVIGLAEPERQPHHQVGPDIADDTLGNRLGVGEFFRHDYSVWRDANRNIRRSLRNRTLGVESIILPYPLFGFLLQMWTAAAQYLLQCPDVRRTGSLAPDQNGLRTVFCSSQKMNA